MGIEEADEFVSIEDYLAGELVSQVKHEYLGGTVHAMAGAKMRHNKATMNMSGSLFASLKGKSCQPFNSDTKVKIELPAHVRFYYPDLQIICGPVDEESTFTDSPTVVIEVLSESTRRIDLGEKRDAYLAIPSLKVLITVDPSKVWAQVDRRRVNGGFDQEHYRNLSEVIELPEAETALPLAEIYESIELSQN